MNVEAFTLGTKGALLAIIPDHIFNIGISFGSPSQAELQIFDFGRLT